MLPATILGSSLSYIDESLVNVALPEIQRSLDASFTTMQWVFNAYMLSLASLILLGGSAGDRFGRRRMFRVGLIAFIAASIAAGLAPSQSWLIGARLAQGMAAALLMPVSLAIVGAAYTGEARGRAIGIWAAAGALAIALSRPLGGWLIDVLGWRAIFFVNVPLAVAALVFASRLAADRSIDESERLDLRGTLLAVLTLALLSYGLITLGEGEGAGVIAVGAAIPAFALFIRSEARASAPMTPLWLFQNRDFTGANALTFLYYAALSGAFFVLPFMLIDVRGYSAVAAGAAFLPLSAFMVFGSRWAGGLVKRFGACAPLVLGSLTTAAGYLLLALLAEHPLFRVAFLPGLLVVGLGVMLTVAPLTTAVFDSVPAERSGAASGINNAVDVAGGLVAVAALGFALGTSSSSTGVEASALASGYPLVMFGAATLTGLSGLIAALTIRTRPKEV